MLVEGVPDPEGVRAEGVGVDSEADFGGETEEGGGAVVVHAEGRGSVVVFLSLFHFCLFLVGWGSGEWLSYRFF